MHFSTPATSVYLVLLLVAVSTFIDASRIEHSNRNTLQLQRRAEAEDSYLFSGASTSFVHSSPAATGTAAISAITESPATITNTATSEHKIGYGRILKVETNNAAGASSSTTGGQGGEQKKGHATSAFASPEILQGGTLFYIGVGVTTFLWITGKAIDIQTERQERYAESLAHSN